MKNIKNKKYTPLFLVFLLLLSLIVTEKIMASSFQFDLGFGAKGIGRGKFDLPVDVVVDSEENIYVLDQGNNRIQKFDKDGDYITEWGKKGTDEGLFDKPTSMYIDADDFIYVTDSLNHRIQKFNTEGIFISSTGILGSRRERFNMPNSIGVDKHNFFYVADTRNNRVQKFTSNWEFKGELGRTGPRNERVPSPSDVTYVNYRFGYIYISSFDNCVVKRYDLKEKYDADIILKPEETDTDINEDEENGDEEESVDEDEEEYDEEESVDEDEENGDEEESVDEEEYDEEEYDEEAIECGIKKIIVDEVMQDDYLMVIFNDRNSIYLYDYEGNYVSMITEGEFEFDNPTSVYIRDRYLYVVDGGNNYIHKFKRR